MSNLLLPPKRIVNDNPAIMRREDINMKNKRNLIFPPLLFRIYKFEIIYQ